MRQEVVKELKCSRMNHLKTTHFWVESITRDNTPTKFTTLQGKELECNSRKRGTITDIDVCPLSCLLLEFHMMIQMKWTVHKSLTNQQVSWFYWDESSFRSEHMLDWSRSSVFSGTKRFITTFTRVRCWITYWSSWSPSTLSHHNSFVIHFNIAHCLNFWCVLLSLKSCLTSIYTSV